MLREFALVFCKGGSARKTRVMPIPDGEKSLTMCALVSTQYQCDGQTDGQICHNNIALLLTMLLLID